MSRALIFHGTCEKEEYFSDNFPSLSNSHWLPWLQKQLLIKNIEAHTPEVKDAYLPSYERWLREIERYSVDSETALVGHSCGGGFLIRWLSENDIKVGRVVLVAPWLNPDNILPIDMFEFEIDPNLTSKTAGLTVFVSDDDMKTVQLSVDKIYKNITDVSVQRFRGMGHFTYDVMKTTEFPELLEEVIR